MRRISRESRGLAEAVKSRYWSEREASAVLAAWHRSGEPARAFALRQGLAPSRILRWQARLSGGREKAQSFFHPVEVVPTLSPSDPGAPGSAPGSPLELVVGASKRILIRRGFDPELLVELVRVLESGAC